MPLNYPACDWCGECNCCPAHDCKECSSPRHLNWYGWSIYTIAAVYESDAAAHEVEKGLVNTDYMVAAFNCEKAELERDEREGIKST